MVITGPAWEPVLAGYPDVGGAALIAIAVGVYLGETGLRDWRRVVLIGILLAAAAVFRRPFAYTSVAFLASIGLHQAILAVAGAHRSFRSGVIALAIRESRVALVGAVCLASLWIFGRGFLESVAGTDFGELYAAYRLPASEVLAYFLAFFGPLAWLLALGGLIAVWRSPSADRTKVGFLPILGAVTLASWAILAGQVNVHYTLQMTMVVLVGIALLVHALFLRLRGNAARGTAMAGVAVLALLNMTMTLQPAILSAPAALAPLLPTSQGPLVRGDLDELYRLVDGLRTQAPHRPIFVVASSFVFNEEILSHAEIQRYGPDAALLDVLPEPAVDSRDAYPLSGIDLADVVVLADPAQYHMAPDQQRVVAVAHDAFDQEWDIAHDFQRQPGIYRLQDGVAVTVFQRVRPSSVLGTRRTLARFEEFVGGVPGTQPDWVVVNAYQSDASLVRNGDGTDTISARPAPAGAATPTVLLYGGPSAASVSGLLSFEDSACPGVTLRLTQYDAGGAALSEQNASRRSTDASEFRMDLSGPPADFLTLELDGFDAASDVRACRVTLGSVRVTPGP